jgi:hypothetical protein
LINKNQILDLGASMTRGYGGGIITSDGNDTTAVNSNTNITGPSQNDMKIVSTADNSPTSSTDRDIDSMSFSLTPMADNTSTQYASSDFTTDAGGIHALVSWEPKQPRAGVESTIYINFSDAFSGEALNANVIYDMSILDVNGTEVLRAENLTAVNSTDSQTITFPTDKYIMWKSMSRVYTEGMAHLQIRQEGDCQRQRGRPRIFFLFVRFANGGQLVCSSGNRNALAEEQEKEVIC